MSIDVYWRTIVIQYDDTVLVHSRNLHVSSSPSFLLAPLNFELFSEFGVDDLVEHFRTLTLKSFHYASEVACNAHLVEDLCDERRTLRTGAVEAMIGAHVPKAVIDGGEIVVRGEHTVRGAVHQLVTFFIGVHLRAS